MCVIDHIVGNDGGRPFGTPFVHQPPQPQPPVIVEQGIERHCFSHRGRRKEPFADLILDMLAGFLYLLHHRAVAQYIGVDRLERLFGNKEEHHRLIEFGLFHLPVEAGKGVDSEIKALVEIFISAGGEEIKRLIEVEGIAGEKMTGNKADLSALYRGGGDSGIRASPQTARY